MAALHVDGTAGPCFAKNEATWPIFVVWIVLNDLSKCDCVAQIADRNFSPDRLIERMTRELKLVPNDPLAYAVDYRHRDRLII